MKTFKTKFSVLILILALALGGQLKAKEDCTCPDKKETVLIKIHAPLLKLLTEALDLDDSAFFVIHKKLEKVKAVTITYCEHELNIVFDKETLDFMALYEEYQSEQLEDWMFEELVSSEEEIALEDWMFDTEYFDEKAAIEDWMLNTEYYNQ